MEPMELRVKEPKILYSDSKGVIDLANDWIIAGSTKHTEVSIIHFSKLKNGELQVAWTPSADNKANVFTKNVEPKILQKHVSMFCKDS